MSRANFDAIGAAARGRWPEILTALGIPAEALTNRHKPCPGCQGTDRFRFDDQDRGAWYCSGGGEPHSGDGFALLSHVRGWTPAESLHHVSDYLWLNGTPRPERKAQPPEHRPEPIPPEVLSSAPRRYRDLGACTAQWAYHDAEGRAVCLVCRFDRPDGGKEFRPLTWSRATGWDWKGLPAPRPLYRLPELLARPDAVVVVCEGEKAADAAAALLPDCVTTTAMNGAQSPSKTDWSPLAGRRVRIWPDNDQAGARYAVEVARLVGAVEVLDVASFPEKWDAADALAEGWTAHRLVWIATTKEGGTKAGPPPLEDGDPGWEASEPARDPGRFTLIDPDALRALPVAPYILKGILPAAGVAAIYGPPKSGKTFLVLDMAAAITEGRPWFGRRTRPCPVVYLGLEGEAGLAQRWRAYHTARGFTPAAPLRFVTAPFSLLEGADIVGLSDAVKAAGCAPGVVVVDTLNAASLGADENGSADMGRIVAGAKRLQRETGGLVLLVHHAGKDAGRGLRGHSSLAGALDTIVEVTRDLNGRRTWCVHRSKDGPESAATEFDLAVVELGEDDDGDVVTSCVVEAANSPREEVPRPPPGGQHQRAVMAAAKPLFLASRDIGKAGAPASRPCVRFDALVEAAAPALVCDQKHRRQRAQEAIRALTKSGHLCFFDDWLWLPDHPGSGFPVSLPGSRPPKGGAGKPGNGSAPEIPGNGKTGKTGNDQDAHPENPRNGDFRESSGLRESADIPSAPVDADPLANVWPMGEL